MVDPLRAKANLISEQLLTLEQEIARLPPASQTGVVKGHGTVDQRESGSGEIVPESPSREALTAMLLHARAAIRGKPFTPLSREHADVLREIRHAQLELGEPAVAGSRFGSEALVKLMRGLKALEGTELEGIIPKEYVQELKDRWMPALVETAFRDVSLLTGEKKFRLTEADEAKSFAQIFGELGQQPIEDLFAKVAGGAICTTCGKSGCTHGGQQIRVLDRGALSALKLALQSLDEKLVVDSSRLFIAVRYAKELTEHVLNTGELGGMTLLQAPRV